MFSGLFDTGRNVILKHACNKVEHVPVCFNPILLLCLPCVGAMARLAGPTAGREGSMGACGPAERQLVTVVIGRTVATLKTAAATLITDRPGKVSLEVNCLFKSIHSQCSNVRE